LKRRAVLRLLAGSAAGAVMGRAAEPHVPTVGFLLTTIAPDDVLLRAFHSKLRELGYVDGRNIAFQFRSARGQLNRLPSMAQELVQLKVDVIVASTEPAIWAAKRTTTSIPIVMASVVTDPVAAGLIESFARPGANVTGVYARQPELIGKRLQLLQETIPTLTRVAVIYDAIGVQDLTHLRSAARSLGIEPVPIEIDSANGLEAAFRTAHGAKVGAVLTLYSVPVYVERERVARLALHNHLPTMAQFPQFPRVGGLMSYGADIEAVFARLAYYVDRILKGALPSELPVEQPATLKLLVNLNAAKALGITIPQSILVQADEVIQ
jgi:putative tryptophan/tyrosine transport system substrate-binding protein